MPKTEVSGSQIKDSSVALSGAASPTGNADVTGVLPAVNGGTGLDAPGANGNVLTSNGTAWTSSAPTGGGGGGGRGRSVSTITSDTTLGSDANTDYYVMLGVAGVGDSSFANVSSLLNFNGANGASPVLDTASPLSTSPWAAFGNAQLSTTVKKYGSASLYLDGAGDYLQGTAARSSLTLSGSAPFTIEMWYYTNTISGSTGIFTPRQLAGEYPTLQLFRNGTQFGWLIATAALNNWSALDQRSATGIAAANTWQHLALVGNGSTIQLYVDGVSRISAAHPAWAHAERLPILGASIDIGNGKSEFHNGYIDDFRFTKGVARYSGTFTPPASGLIGASLPANPTLPTAAGNSNSYIIKNTTASSAVISTTAGQTIDGASSFTLNPNEATTLISDSVSNWSVFSTSNGSVYGSTALSETFNPFLLMGS